MALTWSVHLLLLCLLAPFSTSQNASAPSSCPHCQDDCGGDRSIAYVIDNTGSMRNDIGQVCQRTQEISRVVREHQTSIRRCVMVPFNDPTIGPTQFFNHLDDLASAACDLRPTGGIDCPEKVLSGLLMGLQSSCPKSTVYVFTDAVAKDVELLGKVLEVIQEKQIQVIFVLSGSCDGSATGTYYDTIAAVSGGQLFRVGKGQVGDILTFSQLSVNNAPQTLLLWEQALAPFWSSDFVVEPEMTEVQVAVSCDSGPPSVQLFQPDKLASISPADTSRAVHWQTFPNAVLAKLTTFSADSFGSWQIQVTTSSRCRVSVRAHGVNNTDSAFAKITEINRFGEEVDRKKRGDGSSFVVVSTPDSHIVQYVELVGVDGGRFSSSSPTDGGRSLGSSGAMETILGPTDMPTESFFIRYRGLQNVSDTAGHPGGKPFKRYSPIAVTPKVKPPARGSSSLIQAEHCQDVMLRCPKSSSNAMLPVTWFHNSRAVMPGSPTGVNVTRGADRSTLRIAQFTPLHAGLYACFIAMPTGLKLAAEYELLAEENTTRPCAGLPAAASQPAPTSPSIWNAHHSTVHCLILQCLARGDVEEPEQVTWSNTQSNQHYDRTSVHRHYAVLRNGSLRICNPQQQHMGWYMCRTPHVQRPSAVRVTAADLQAVPGSGDEDRENTEDESERIIALLQKERDTAQRERTTSTTRIAELENTVLSLQRQMADANAGKLASDGLLRTATQDLTTCQRRLRLIRRTLGLNGRL